MSVSISMSDLENKYRNSVLEAASDTAVLRQLQQTFGKKHLAAPKIYYRSLIQEHSISSTEELLTQADLDLHRGNTAKWDLDPNFFVDHATNTPTKDIWLRQYRLNWSSDATIDQAVSAPYACLCGIFEYFGYKRRFTSILNSNPNLFPRESFEDGGTIQSNTTISYYRATDMLYLILVDAPLSLQGCSRTADVRAGVYRNARMTSRFKYANNRGGVVLPQLFEQEAYSLLEALKAFFQHGWQLATLFDSIPGVMPPPLLLYMLSSSLWEANLRYLDTKIKRLSFNDIRRPSLKINHKLHDCREDLEKMKTSIVETRTYFFPEIPTLFQQLPRFQETNTSRDRTPLQKLERTLEEVEKLGVFLMDTFQLLMSSISVEQAQRGTRLTQLAFIYVPLSFVTGIFGMNLKEINGSSLPSWVVAVALAAVVICTVAIFSALRKYLSKEPRVGEW